MSDNSKDCVKVAVRVRPLVESELAKGCQKVIVKEPNEPQISVSGDRFYTFNHVFMPEDDQPTIYNEAVRDMIDKIFEGYNVTILAYGQTSSGKTYTMGTTYSGEDDSSCGIIPRAMSDIFQQIEELKKRGYTFTVACTFLELYQEDLYDLLSDKPREGNTLDIREHNNNIVIPGVTEVAVSSARETTDCLIRGSSGRAVGATAMNAQSSRSHAIFSVNIDICSSAETVSAKFQLVDLAGSERASKTKATGERFKEGVKINQGLLCLGNVISALGSGNQQGNFVSYRDSKLTRLLQGSLGGNSVTLMIACVSPADYNLEETVSTLRYANRAKKIKNKPVVNRDPNLAELMELRKTVQQLQLKLLANNGPQGSVVTVTAEDSNLRRELIFANERNIKLQREFQATLNDLADFQMKCVMAENINEEVLKLVEELRKGTDEYSTTYLQADAEASLEQQVCAFEKIKGIVGSISQCMMQHKEEVDRMNETAKSFSLDLIARDSVDTVEMQQKLEACTTKQVSFSNELRNLNLQLAQKEELHKKCVENLMREEVRDYESKINALEHEREELLSMLENVKKTTASAKLAEVRRKRLQTLEQEMADTKKKMLQQAKLLKVRERDSQKVVTLTQEIQQMRQAKVKLIRAMRAENENFRNWKQAREKEMCQLKEKDRKRENEMKRMAAIHNKQSNVLKRKFEEAVAKAKRLEETLDRQRTVQAMRKGNISKIGVDNITTWLDHEIELMMNTVDAKVSLDHLMEDRGMVTMRLNETRALPDPNLDEVAELEEDLQLRNAQITDLQQKTMNFNVTTKAKTISDGIVSLQDARVGIKHIFGILADLRRDNAQKDTVCDSYKTEVEELREKVEKMENELKESKRTHAIELNEADKNYQEKISIVLRNIQDGGLNTSGRVKEIDTALLDNYDELRQKYDTLKTVEQELRAEVESLKQPKRKKSYQPPVQMNRTMDIFTESESESEEEQDNSSDVEWRLTPFMKKTRHITSERSSNEGQNKRKRKSDNSTSTMCSCKTDCSKNICGCRRGSKDCSDKCRCSSTCVNKSANKSEVSSTNEDLPEAGDEDDKENTPVKKSKSDPEFKEPDHLTPYPYKNKKRTFYE
ncbi:chromosome-associated kinesin KIF4A [Phlebotomus argentipes]|uniref:chromosome-associated kinesin KIF4A n=1 Tax=Phlebotomus argentipes TaxID=94469 RepID=UPI002892BEEA|nr:chromosome-associated kinesin KIF4A [Phlebotomus argentipes]